MEKIASMNLEEDVYKHFQENMVPKILSLQATHSGSVTDVQVLSIDKVGEEIVDACQSLHIFEVSIYMLLQL